jgi:hypothetical protein
VVVPREESAATVNLLQVVDAAAPDDDDEDEEYRNEPVEERDELPPPPAKYGRSYKVWCGKKEGWFTPSRLPPTQTHHKGKPIWFKGMWVAANFFATCAGMRKDHRNPMVLIDVEVEEGLKCSMKEIIDTHYSQH